MKEVVDMTLGVKIQFLRKQNGMSQEQLASQLTVSRQAISKWELDSCVPDTDNIVQLSKLFKVSTDYLLNDDIECDINHSDTKNDSNCNKFAVDSKTAFIVGIGIIAIGFIVSFVGMDYYQSDLVIAIGFAIQIIGIIIFELICKKSDIRRSFYSVSCWLISPAIVLFLFEKIMNFYPRPYFEWTGIIIQAILYFTICITITLVLRMCKKSKK